MVNQPGTFIILIMFAYIKYLFFSPMLFLNLHLFHSSEIPLNTQISLDLSYYKKYGKHYRYCYIIHLEIQYMHYKQKNPISSFTVSSRTHFTLMILIRNKLMGFLIIAAT